MINLKISNIFNDHEVVHTRRIKGASRRTVQLEGASCIVDEFETAKSAFLRVSGCPEVEIYCPEKYNIQKVAAGGHIASPANGKGPHYWIPVGPVQRVLDPLVAIRSEQQSSVHALKFSANQISIVVESAGSSVLDLIIWEFSEQFPIEQLTELYPIEEQGYFLWGSHGCYKKPGDLYNHLIHGAVYDLRYTWPAKKKCFSENEAHTLYTCFSGLEKATSKQLYRNFQLQLVLSLFDRQAADGGFHHGIWTDNNETHYRLHTSAVHLLLDEYHKTHCKEVLRLLQKAIAFSASQTDTLECGTWFLHDSLELSEEAMNSAPFKWIPSKVLGKRASNMLILNTHLDTSVAIRRYGQLTGDPSYEPLLKTAHAATETVLAMKPAERLYRALFWIIGLTLLPAERAAKLPLPLRALKRLGWKHLIPRLPDIKARFPRLVMPNGYIDRELSLRTWAIDYQTINLMDLARYNRLFSSTVVASTLDDSVSKTHCSGLIQRYGELAPGKRYAVGFWQEALYHCCLASDNPSHRQWLFEAVLEGFDGGHGTAPSLLGCNGEAVPPEKQLPTPMVQQDNLIVANLSRGDDIEYLLVNTATDEQTVTWINPPHTDVCWFDPNGNTISLQRVTVSPRSWVRGYYQPADASSTK